MRRCDWAWRRRENRANEDFGQQTGNLEAKLSVLGNHQCWDLFTKPLQMAERGIRTPGTSKRHNGFRDRRILFQAFPADLNEAHASRAFQRVFNCPRSHSGRTWAHLGVEMAQQNCGVGRRSRLPRRRARGASSRGVRSRWSVPSHPYQGKLVTRLGSCEKRPSQLATEKTRSRLPQAFPFTPLVTPTILHPPSQEMPQVCRV